jgi:hypothetical protein
MILPPKGFATHITRKWSLIGMRPLMNEQIVGLGEFPIAELADEPLLRFCKHSSLFWLCLQHMLQEKIGRKTCCL